MSFDGPAASSSGCAIKPKEHETGLAAFVGRTGFSLRTGFYVMATAEHREPCDSRGSCTVLGAPGGAIPPGDSTIAPLTLCPLPEADTDRTPHVQKVPDSDSCIAAKLRDELQAYVPTKRPSARLADQRQRNIATVLLTVDDLQHGLP
jgi:hypothetical protein